MVANELADKIKGNSFYVKSVMERIFSPTGKPTESLLRGNMDLSNRDNISPFINLPYTKEVAIKTISN